MDSNFTCTQCGDCCRDLKLPLSVAEGVHWLSRGHDVQVLCEAIPWPEDRPAEDLQAAYKHRRSFAVRSGSGPARVIVTLVASFQGDCPNLLSDSRCGIYAIRPRVCRIYPAEINPFLVPVPALKACPPEAWGADCSPFMRGGLLVDADTRALIDESIAASLNDVAVKALLCNVLGIRTAAMANEGFAVHAPSRALLAQTLNELMGIEGAPSIPVQAGWTFVSQRAETVAALAEIGMDAMAPDAAGEYLSLVR